MKIEFVHAETNRVIGILSEDLEPSNSTVASVLRAKRRMGWTDDEVRQRLPGWSNGYYFARQVD